MKSTLQHFLKILLFLCVFSLAVAHAASYRVVPSTGTVNESFKFTATLDGNLPSGYYVGLNLMGSDGNWLNTTYEMRGSGSYFYYNRTISSAGTNRRWRIAVFFESTNARATSWVEGAPYNVVDQEYEFSSGYPKASDSSVVVGEDVTFYANTTESVHRVEIDMGGGDGYQTMSSNSSKTRWTTTRRGGFTTEGRKTIRFRILDEKRDVKETDYIYLSVDGIDFSSGYPRASHSSLDLGQSVIFYANLNAAASRVEINMGGGGGYYLMNSNVAKTQWRYTRSNGFVESGYKTIRFRVFDSSYKEITSDSISVRVNSPRFSSGYPKANKTSFGLGEAATFYVNTSSYAPKVEIGMGGGSGFRLMTSNSSKTQWNFTRQDGFAEPGNKLIAFRILDFNGNVIEQKTVSVTAIKPQFSSGYPKANKTSFGLGEAATFYVNTSSYAPKVEIDMGGGSGFKLMTSNSSKTQWNFTRQDGFAEPGNKPIAFRILDFNGNVVEQKTISVTAIKPQFSSGYPKANKTNVTVGEAITFYANTNSLAPRVEIDMGGGSGFQLMSSNATKTEWHFTRSGGFLGGGNHSAQFRILDLNGNVVDQSSITVNVKQAQFISGYPKANKTSYSLGERVIFYANTNVGASAVEIDMGGGDGYQSMSPNSQANTEWSYTRSTGFVTSGQKTISFRILNSQKEVIAEADIVLTVNGTNINTLIDELSKNDSPIKNMLQSSNLSRQISRAEASILLDTFLISEESSFNVDLSDVPSPFSDVNTSASYLDAIRRLAYFTGSNDNLTVVTRDNTLFRPLDAVTRQEFLKMVMQGIDVKLEDETIYLSGFSDRRLVEGTIWQKYFNTAVKLKFIFGTSEGKLAPLDNITLREALYILARTQGSTNHSADGFGQISFPPDYPNDKVYRGIGFDYLSEHRLPDEVPIDVTNVDIIAPNAMHRSACRMPESEEFLVLQIKYTASDSPLVTPYFWWRSSDGYFKQYGNDTTYEKVCFLPSLANPVDDYFILAEGNDNIGFLDGKGISLPNDVFSYDREILLVDEPKDQSIDVRYKLNRKYIIPNRLLEIDLSETAVNRMGVGLGLEHARVKLVSGSEEVIVYAGPVDNGRVSFMLPAIEVLNGSEASLEIYVNTDQLYGTATIDGLIYTAPYVITGVVNSAYEFVTESLTINGEVVYLEDGRSFYFESDPENGVTDFSVSVNSYEIANTFDEQTVGFNDGQRVAHLIFDSYDATDSDSDMVYDSIDNCDEVYNPDQLDRDFDGVGDLCDERPLLEAPSSVVASNGDYENEVQIRWDESVFADRYLIYRCDTNRVDSCFKIAFSEDSPFVDVEGNANQIYYYRVRTCVNEYCGYYSKPAIGKKGGSSSVPETPSIKTVVESHGSLTIEWELIDSATSYQLFRCEGKESSTCRLIANTTDSFYVDTDIKQGIMYNYRLKACNLEGCSVYSADILGESFSASGSRSAIIMYILEGN